MISVVTKVGRPEMIKLDPLLVVLIKCLEAGVGQWGKPRVWVRGTLKGTGVSSPERQADLGASGRVKCHAF